MDEIEQRLKASAENCVTCYEAWRKDEKNSAVRASLQDAVHEIRKVASRLEIEMAVSERDEMAQRPIPIPPHRDARKRHNHNQEDHEDNFGNSDGSEAKKSKGGGQRRSGGGGRSGGARRDRSGGGKNADNAGNE